MHLGGPNPCGPGRGGGPLYFEGGADQIKFFGAFFKKKQFWEPPTGGGGLTQEGDFEIEGKKKGIVGFFSGFPKQKFSQGI